MAKNDDNGADEFERITPVSIRPAAPRQAAGQDPGPRTVPMTGVIILLLVLLLVAAGVFLWLGRSTPPPQQAAAPASTPAQPSAKTPPAGKGEQSAPDVDQVLAARQHAQALGRKLAGKRKQLTDHGVTRWAAKQSADIGKLAAGGKRHFDQREYAAATSAYQKASAQADRLLGRVRTVLDDALARGQKALKDDDSDAAVKAFALALAVEPGNTKAKQGAAHAANRDRVLALMRAGRASEQQGDLDAARKSYRQAQALDGAYQPVQQALQRTAAALAKRGFDRHMSAGLAALNRNDYAAARKAFDAARKIRPNASEAADGLAQANAGLQNQAIAAHRAKAQAAASAEQWHTAETQYGRILAIDPSLTFASQGRKQAATRAALEDKLSYHLGHLQRLSDAAVRADVRKLLTKARAVAQPGPRLRGQIQRLSAQLATASQTQPVQLQSDGRTRVAVYHVGRLGRFKSKELQLTPGTYTAVGHRDGYRDVRLQFTVTAGASTGPITIRCRDKL